MNFVLTNKKFKTCQYLNQYDIKLRNSLCKNKIIKKKTNKINFKPKQP